MAFSWIAAVLCYNGLVFNSVNIGGSVYVNMALGVVIEVCMNRGLFNGIGFDNDISSMVARWQNLIPSFPLIAPGWRAWGGAIQGKEGIQFCSVA